MEETKNRVSSCQELSNMLTCCKNNKVTLLCSSQQCKQYAGLCIKQDCDCKTKVHNQCLDFTNAKSMFSLILAKRKNTSQQIDLVFQKIQKIYDQLIDKLSQQKQALLKFKQNYGLNKNQINLFQNIQFNLKEKIAGKDVYQVKSKLKETTFLDLTQKQVNQIWKSQKNKIDQSLKKINYFFNDLKEQNIKPDVPVTVRVFQKLYQNRLNNLQKAFQCWRQRTIQTSKSLHRSNY